jgi:Sec-independent protein translocase protein TatA
VTGVGSAKPVTWGGITANFSERHPMAADKEPMEDSSNKLKEAAKTFANEIEDIVTNDRWLTTLVIAEFAGIASYRDLQHVTTLSVGFLLVASVLALSLLFFMISVISGRTKRREISKSLWDHIGEFRKVADDKNNTTSDGNATIKRRTERALMEFSQYPDTPRTLETVGIFLFILASLLGAMVLFWNELVSLF